jgi:hypothetical protein
VAGAEALLKPLERENFPMNIIDGRLMKKSVIKNNL